MASFLRICLDCKKLIRFMEDKEGFCAECQALISSKPKVEAQAA